MSNVPRKLGTLPKVVLVGVVGVIGLLLLAPTSKNSDLVEITTTIVPSDAQDLDCDAASGRHGEFCAYANGQRVPTVAQPLRPFATLKHEVVLMSGVFELDVVKTWLTKTQTTGPRDQRVRLDCTGTSLGAFDRVGLHWRAGAPFDPSEKVPAVHVKTCKLAEFK